MRDLVMLATIVGFFALCLAYVWWCDRIIGPDPAELGGAGEAAASDDQSEPVTV